MNKEISIENARRKFSGELLDIVLQQINDHYDLIDSNYQVEVSYKIGDDVILNKNHLLHGIGKHTDLIEDVFSKRGIISQDFFGADYLIYGIPKCCIEGILVGRDLEKDLVNLSKLKELFPKCYICNLDGKVIA